MAQRGAASAASAQLAPPTSGPTQLDPPASSAAESSLSRPDLAFSLPPAETPTRHPAIPGPDLAIFLLLLFVIDISGLLHVYSLSSLYGETLFFGLGLLTILFAVWLLLLPRPGANLRSPVAIAQLAIAALLAVALVTPALGQFFAALPFGRVRPIDPPVQMPADVEGAFLIVILAGLTVLAFGLGYTRQETNRRRWLTILAAAFFSYAVGNVLYHVTGLPAGNEWYAVLLNGWVGPLVALALLALALIAFPLRPEAFLIVTLVLGVGLRVVAFLNISISMKLGDMLPLIGMSTDRMLGGASPYNIYSMPYELPLTYWPLNVLPFVPFRLLGIDLRFANLLLGLVVGAALLLLRRGGRDPGWACYAFGVLYVTPTMLQWDLVTAAPPFWLWVALLLAVVAWDGSQSLAGGKWRAALPGLASGAAVAAGPLVLPFLPFVGILWLKRGLRYALAQVGIALATFALVLLPFALWDWDNYWLGTLHWFNDIDKLPTLKWLTDQSWLYEIGIAGQMWKGGLQDWLKPLQVAILLALSAIAWWRMRGPADALRWGSAAYLLFMVVNPVIWPYLFTPALLGLVFTLAARRPVPSPQRREGEDGALPL